MDSEGPFRTQYRSEDGRLSRRILPRPARPKLVRWDEAASPHVVAFLPHREHALEGAGRGLAMEYVAIDLRRVIAQHGVRGVLVRTRTRWINVVRALLRREGCHVPSGTAESFRERVEALELTGELRNLVAPMLALMDPLNEKLTKLDREMAALGKEDPRLPLLQTLPMIGPVSAMSSLVRPDGGPLLRLRPVPSDAPTVRRRPSAATQEREEKGEVTRRNLRPTEQTDQTGSLTRGCRFREGGAASEKGCRFREGGAASEKDDRGAPGGRPPTRPTTDVGQFYFVHIMCLLRTRSVLRL
jgi:hypothetical protein